MPAYYALLVPGGLALFAALVGFIFVALERRRRAKMSGPEKKVQHA